jgi:hypothetical protein
MLLNKSVFSMFPLCPSILITVLFLSFQIEEVGEEAGSGSAQAQSQAHAQVQLANDTACSGKGKESEFYNSNLSFTQLLTVILFILLVHEFRDHNCVKNLTSLFNMQGPIIDDFITGLW